MLFAGTTLDGKAVLVFVPQGVKVDTKMYLDILKKRAFCLGVKPILRQNLAFQQDGAPVYSSYCSKLVSASFSKYRF